MEWNPDSTDRPWEPLHPLTRSCFLLFLLGRLSLLALFSSSLESAFVHGGVHPFLFVLSLCSPSHLPRCGSRLPCVFFPHDLVLWTDGSVLFSLGRGGSGILAICSLCGTETTFSFSEDPVCLSFSAEACAILHALCWSGKHQQICHFSYLTLFLFSPQSFLLSQTLWQELSSLSSCSIRLQWVPGHSFLPGNDATDELARRGALLAPSATPGSFSRIHFSQTGGVLSHSNFLTRRFPRFPPRNLCSFVTLNVFFLVFAATDTALF